MSKRIIIIGGGASGMLSAITAAGLSDSEAEVIICEKNRRLGKKLLATGNGRCNITNTDCGCQNYHGKTPAFVRPALRAFGPAAALEFFHRIGLTHKITHGGRVYPYCEQASAVVDVLRNALAHLGVTVRTDTEVIGADKTADGFTLRLCGTEEVLNCDRLVVACGGKSAPSTGSNGGGLTLLSELGHRIIEPYPALTQLKTDTTLTAPMQGVRVNAKVRVRRGAGITAESTGEVQFTTYGLSGPAVMDISAQALAAGAVVCLDLFPHAGELELMDILAKRRENLAYLTAESFLIGMFNKKVGQVIQKHSGIAKLSLPVGEISDGQLTRLAREIKNLEFTVKGHTGWEHAQTTGGGADTAEFNSATMESLIVNGLFATGEVLDIYGDCGGYNLQWAWSSGYAAGVNV